MNIKDIFTGSNSKFFWWNIAGMAVTVVAIVLVTLYGLDLYTHHNEEIKVPDFKGMQLQHAQSLIENKGLICVVADTGYVRNAPVGSVLMQTPEPGTVVKEGRTVYLTINSGSVPTMTLPDIADNCSLNGALAKLQAMGFKIGKTEYTEGEKDWVVAVKVRGRKVSAGDRIPTDAAVTLVVGDGSFYSSEDVSEDDVVNFSTDDVDIPDLETVVKEATEPAPSTTPAQQKQTPPSKGPAKKKDTDDSWF